MPTAVHSFWPTRIFWPTFNPANARAAPTPTTTSLRPDSNFRPSTILMSLCTAKAAFSTPRKGTLASVPVDRLGRLMITNNSAAASGPSAERATPGASEMRRVSARESTLVISVSAPLRSTTAKSAGPLGVIAARKPAAIESTPTKTATTPAMPTAAAVAAPLRSGSVRRLKSVTLVIWESQLNM